MTSIQNTHQRGDTFCRPSDWIDVVQFFFLNYGLHAFTVVTEPGSTPLASILISVVATFMPSVGIGGAFKVLHRYANGGKTDLEVALKAGTLCTIVPFIKQEPDKKGAGTTQANESADKKIESEKLISSFVPIVPQMTQIHGQYPAKLRDAQKSDSEKGQPLEDPLPKFSLVQVPDWFTIHPLIGESRQVSFMDRIKKLFTGPKPGEVNLACNYSFVKTVAAII